MPAPPQPRPYVISCPEEGEAEVPDLSLPRTGRERLLVSLDYDGTLHQREKGLEAGFFNYMRRLREHGVLWGLNTGRSLRAMAGELAAFEHMPDFICTCERYAYVADAEGRLQPASTHNARCHEANLRLREQTLPAWEAMLRALRQELPDLPWQLAVEDPLSIEAADSATMDAIMPYLLPFEREGAALQRADRFVRLCDARFNKGSVLRYVQQLRGVEESSLFLMGDGHNDIDAFRHFPHAFRAAPANAHPEVQAWLREHGGYLSPEPGVLPTLSIWASRRALPTP